LRIRVLVAVIPPEGKLTSIGSVVVENPLAECPWLLIAVSADRNSVIWEGLIVVVEVMVSPQATEILGLPVVITPSTMW
jgi:hypothetical protein